MYGENRVNGDISSILTDTITSLELHKAISGPKIYAFFPFGRLEEYINVNNVFFMTLCQEIKIKYKRLIT